MLEEVDIPNDKSYRNFGELSPDETASVYEKTLQQNFENQPIPCFDLTFFGMGADGHTALLFQGAEV